MILNKSKLLEAKSPRIKESLQEEYSILNVQAKRSARADKRQLIENLATEAEAAARPKEQATRGYHVRLTRGRTPVQMWLENFFA